MVDFCCSRCRCIGNYFVDGKLPGNKSGDCKPCEEFKNRIIPIAIGSEW